MLGMFHDIGLPATASGPDFHSDWLFSLLPLPRRLQARGDQPDPRLKTLGICARLQQTQPYCRGQRTGLELSYQQATAGGFRGIWKIAQPVVRQAYFRWGFRLEYIFNLEIIFYPLLNLKLNPLLNFLIKKLFSHVLLLKFFANGFDSLQVQGA
jgi:hypothetical protein